MERKDTTPRTFVRHRTILTCCVLMLAPAFAAAQQSQPRGPISADAPRRSVALGTDPFALNLSSREPGVKAQMLGTLAREWRQSESGFGFRAQLLLGRDLPSGQRFTGGSCTTSSLGCEISVSRQFAGLTGALTHEWRRGTGLRPYVVGGPGLYIERTDASAKDLLLSAPAFLPPTGTHASLGVMGGAGVAFRIGGTDLFVEQAFHLSEVLSNVHSGDLVSHPLSFGIRF